MKLNLSDLHSAINETLEKKKVLSKEGGTSQAPALEGGEEVNDQ